MSKIVGQLEVLFSKSKFGIRTPEICQNKQFSKVSNRRLVPLKRCGEEKPLKLLGGELEDFCSLAEKDKLGVIRILGNLSKSYDLSSEKADL